jgi:hypothetical protein
MLTAPACPRGECTPHKESLPISGALMQERLDSLMDRRTEAPLASEAGGAKSRWD